MRLGPEHTADRHPAVVTLAGYFDAGRFPDPFGPIAAELEHTARTMLEAIPDHPELTVGLRKLLEARECFMRAAREAAERGDLRTFPGSQA